MICLSTSINVNAQDSIWTSEELVYYSTAKALCKFLTESKYDTSKWQASLDKYVLFFEIKVGKRFFKSTKAAYKPFEDHLKSAATSTSFYYNMKQPFKPWNRYCLILKVRISWRLWLDFGNGRAFLTPNFY